MAPVNLVRLHRLNEENRLLSKLIEWGAIKKTRDCCGEPMSLIYEKDRPYPRFYCGKTNRTLENGVWRKKR